MMRLPIEVAKERAASWGERLSALSDEILNMVFLNEVIGTELDPDGKPTMFKDWAHKNAVDHAPDFCGNFQLIEEFMASVPRDSGVPIPPFNIVFDVGYSEVVDDKLITVDIKEKETDQLLVSAKSVKGGRAYACAMIRLFRKYKIAR